MRSLLILLTLSVLSISCNRDSNRFPTEILYSEFENLKTLELPDGYYKAVQDERESSSCPELVQFHLKNHKLQGAYHQYTSDAKRFVSADFDHGYIQAPIKFFYLTGQLKALGRIQDSLLLLDAFWDKDGTQTVTNGNGLVTDEIKWEYIDPSLKPSREIWRYEVKDGRPQGQVTTTYFEFNSNKKLLSMAWRLKKAELWPSNRGYVFSYYLSHNFFQELDEVE